MITAVITFLLGIPSAYKISFQDNQDTVWGVALLISGVLFAYAVFKNGIDNVRGMINESSWVHIGRWFNACVVAIPLIFVIVFGWWVYQAVSWYPKTWWNPFERTSPGTMALQWALLMITVLILNRWFTTKVKGARPHAPGPERREEVTP